MINGPLVGGFLIALTIVLGTYYAGTRFQAAVAFADAHTLDAARGVAPLVCSFSIDDIDARRTGQIYVRDGMMRFAIRDQKGDSVVSWGVEIDMSDIYMMSQSTPDEPFVSLDNYPNIRVQVLEDLKMIIKSEKLHCAPWWSGKSHRFNVERSRT